MARLSGPIQEVSRLLDLVPYLSTHSHVSLKELAQEFGVSEREMSNELIALSMCGLPGYTPYELIEVFFDSGFVTINNHETLDLPRALTNLEIASLLIGLEILKDAIVNSDEKLSAKVDTLISQLSALVGMAIEIDENPIAAHLADIHRAIATRSSLSITYESSLSGEQKSRLIDPLSIYNENGNTYLSAYCYLAESYRNFRMDRILAIETSQQQAGSHAGDEPLAEKELFSLSLHGRTRSIAEFLGIQTLSSLTEIEIAAYSSSWIEKAVVSFAPDLELSAPNDLRAPIQRRLIKILDLYRS